MLLFQFHLVERGLSAPPHSRKRPLPTFRKFHDMRPGVLTRVSTVLCKNAFEDIKQVWFTSKHGLNFRVRICPSLGLYINTYIKS